MPNRIKLEGAREFEKKLKQIHKEIRAEVTEEIKDAGRKWEQGAKRDAPKDQGRLAQSIKSKGRVMEAEVTVSVEYAPYVEWGTKRRVKVPADIADYASQFRGNKGGVSGLSLQKLLYAWMDRVGIPDDKQWAVLMSILANGIKPHPFFFIQRPKVEADMIKNIKAILNTEH